jgi:hypothetical protein
MDNDIAKLLNGGSYYEREYISTEHLLSKESGNFIEGDVVVREIKIFDQFSNKFFSLIDKYKTSKSICGYLVSGLSSFIAENLSYTNSVEDLVLLIHLLNDESVVLPLIEQAMIQIQKAREDYILKNKQKFSDPEINKYISDWVANYEISDYLMMNKNIQNLFFLRYVVFHFPTIAKDLKHEELLRSEEEEPFKEEVFIIESFHVERTLKSIVKFKADSAVLRCYEENKGLVFAGDFRGHFVILLNVKIVKQNGELENSILLLNSINTNYLSHIEEINTLINIINEGV